MSYQQTDPRRPFADVVKDLRREHRRLSRRSRRSRPRRVEHIERRRRFHFAIGVVVTFVVAVALTLLATSS